MNDFLIVSIGITCLSWVIIGIAVFSLVRFTIKRITRKG